MRSEVYRVDHPFRTTRKLFGPTLLDIEGTEHSRRKRAWMQLFCRAEMETRVNNIVARAVDAGFAHAHACGDLARLCTWIPNRIILDLLNRLDIDADQHYRTVRAAADILETNVLGPDFETIRNYLRDPAFHVADLFSDMNEETRPCEIAALLVAGVETTIVALEIILRSWAADAKAFAERVLAEGPAAAVMHILCADPPLGSAMRYVHADTVLGTAACPAGTILKVDIASVSAPQSEISQILFGHGRHQCPGRPLALRELVLVTERLSRLSPEAYDILIGANDVRPETFRHPGAFSVRVRVEEAEMPSV